MKMHFRLIIRNGLTYQDALMQHTENRHAIQRLDMAPSSSVVNAISGKARQVPFGRRRLSCTDGPLLRLMLMTNSVCPVDF